MTGIAQALRVFEPTEAETLLFKAALNNSESALALLQEAERTEQPELIPYLAGPGKWMRALQPLIYANVAKADRTVPLACRPYLKTATLREIKRYALFLKGLRDGIAVLNASGISFCVVKGVAAAHTVYADPVLRHCHDVDVILLARDLKDIIAAFGKNDFRVLPSDSNNESVTVVHASGLPFTLHSKPIRGDSRFDADWLLQDSQNIETQAGSFSVPAPDRRILHAWLHRLQADRYERHTWVPDTVLTLRCMEEDDLDRLNRELSCHTLPEALTAAHFLSEHIDNLPALKELRFSAASRRGQTRAQQRSRFLSRAHAQDNVSSFWTRLGPVTRTVYIYDKLFPPRGFFHADAHYGLWSLRLRRLVRAGLRLTSDWVAR